MELFLSMSWKECQRQTTQLGGGTAVSNIKYVLVIRLGYLENKVSKSCELNNIWEVLVEKSTVTVQRNYRTLQQCMTKKAM